MKTPVILIIFNRPDETQRVFDAVRIARPPKLLVICDGPRNKADEEKIDESKAIIETVDWECEVIRNYSDTNIGCRSKLSSGLQWAFSIVDRAIVFESDCLPDQTFFKFCDELLEKYKDDEEIMHIGGNFFQQRNDKFTSKDSYYFSSIPHIWGWATWSRAWKYYDPDLIEWPKVKADGTLSKILKDPAVYEYWSTVFDAYYDKKLPSWDGQWTFQCIMRGGLSIIPSVNLVTNIGFGPQAMQTKDAKSIFSNIPLNPMLFPLKHPDTIRVNIQADNFTWRQNFGINRYWNQRIFGPIRRTFPYFYKTIRNLFKK
jgi:hypothetical protein